MCGSLVYESKFLEVTTFLHIANKKEFCFLQCLKGKKKRQTDRERHTERKMSAIEAGGIWEGNCEHWLREICTGEKMGGYWNIM